MPKTDLSMKAKDIHDREMRVMEMLRAGMSDQQIADEIGYADDSAVTHIRRRVTERYTGVATEDYRAQQLDRIDALLQSLWASARKKDYQAVDRVVKLMERQAKLVGLDAATKVDMTVQEVSPDEVQTFMAGAYAQWQAEQAKAKPKKSKAKK